jgi:hypothetical protein
MLLVVLVGIELLLQFLLLVVPAGLKVDPLLLLLLLVAARVLLVMAGALGCAGAAGSWLNKASMKLMQPKVGSSSFGSKGSAVVRSYAVSVTL